MEGAKNLAAKAVEALAGEKPEVEKWAAGATEKPSEAELHGKILEFLWWMKKQGYKETTISGKGSRLRRLVRLGANLLNPESVKEVIAMQDWCDSGKETTAYAYDLFARWMGINWQRPNYKAPKKLPFIPHEREIDDLIAGCNKHVAVFLQVIKETAARAGEVFNLKWIDIDFENRTIRITPEKGGEPRMFKISRRLIQMLEGLPRNGERVFSKWSSLRNLTSTFERNRKRAAYKLGNPRILKISFHTLRHWKATMEYHKTKDILHVMQMLGHRNIKNTLIYTQLINNEGDDEYICKAAKTIEQAAELIEAGFEYVCEIDGVKLFRKRK
jgi:integrase